MESAKKFESVEKDGLAAEIIGEKASAMISYVSSPGFRERMSANFRAFAKQVPVLQGSEEFIFDSVGREYNRSLLEDQEIHSELLNLLDSYRTTIKPLNRSAIESQIIDRVVNGEVERRRKALGGNRHAVRETKINVKDVFDEFFNPLETLKSDEKNTKELFDDYTKLQSELSAAERAKTHGGPAKERVQELRQKLQETMKAWKASASKIEEAKNLLNFIPGYDKELELWKKENPRSSPDAKNELIKAMIGKAFNQLLERRARARTKRFEKYGGGYLEGEDPLEMLVEDEKDK